MAGCLILFWSISSGSQPSAQELAALGAVVSLVLSVISLVQIIGDNGLEFDSASRSFPAP